MDDEPALIDYSIDEYRELLKVKGRCTLGNKTVYKVYVYTSDYARRTNYCGLYIVEEYARNYVYGDVPKPYVVKFTLNTKDESIIYFPYALYTTIFRDEEWKITHLDEFHELRHITELIFCDTYRCYPTALGLFPLTGNTLKLLTGESLRRDVLIEFLIRYGAVSITDYIVDNTKAHSFYISIQRVKYDKIKALIFIPVENPAYHAVRVSELQLVYKKVIPQLETLILTNLESSDPKKLYDGLKILGITEEKIYKAFLRYMKEDLNEDDDLPYKIIKRSVNRNRYFSLNH